ncbi:MAG: hypothetical protein JWN17_161 [Frankiales bacterium]|nr:hypothetical protein [Frankiales bacterium]
MLRLAALAAVLLLLTGAEASGAADDPPALDVPAVAAALRTQPLVRTPGATAVLDERAVRSHLTPSARIVLAPPRPLSAKGDDYAEVYAPLSDAADEAHLDLVLVRGTKVQLVGQGTAVPDDLPGARALLGQHDVTEQVVYALDTIRDPHLEDSDDESLRPLRTVAAPAALVRQVVDGLTAHPTWVAPGVPEPVTLRPGPAVRVAVLPLLPRGAPWPDVATPVSARFPGELVVVARGQWVDAAGPRQADADLARDQVLGLYLSPLTERAAPTQNVVRLFLDRYELLGSGVAFGRPRVRPVGVRELFARWAPPVALALAVVVGGGALLRGVAQRRRREREQTRAYREGVADVLARVAALDVALLSSGRPESALAEAAVEQQTARDLLLQAQRDEDPALLDAARDAAEAVDRLLHGAQA